MPESTLIEKQEKRIRELLGARVTPEILAEINEALVSPFYCETCKFYHSTPICPDCEPEKIIMCSHLCTYCGNIFSHNKPKCFISDLGLCERCQGFENELRWEKLRKEIGIKVDTKYINFVINERERCLEKMNAHEMTMEELEKHIFSIEEEIKKITAISGGARSARIAKLEEMESKGIRTNRDLFLLHEQEKANKKEAKVAVKNQTKLEKMIGELQKANPKLTTEKATKYAKALLGEI